MIRGHVLMANFKASRRTIIRSGGAVNSQRIKPYHYIFCSSLFDDIEGLWNVRDNRDGIGEGAGRTIISSCHLRPACQREREVRRRQHRIRTARDAAGTTQDQVAAGNSRAADHRTVRTGFHPDATAAQL